MSFEDRISHNEEHAGWSHRHRDVSGGWLRPTVFGAVDGLVTNAALIAGVAEAFNTRIDGMVSEVVTSIRGSDRPRHIATSARNDETPMRAD